MNFVAKCCQPPGILGDFAVDRWKFIDFTRPGILRSPPCTDKKWNSPFPYHSEIGESKSLFLLTVALLCFQAKKLPFSHGNGHSDWLTEWLLLYNYQIIYRLANTKDLRFST